ncbi:unnamed protein product [Phyllotreta striolata]|uniref:Uncharacterized protein n=1 Tax=Phyllotreta striolata TaxID=444603 RepID=A0A9N9XLS1_PHYSR|nr:unnamed protein product [Phyllotreta striolata]
MNRSKMFVTFLFSFLAAISFTGVAEGVEVGDFACKFLSCDDSAAFLLNQGADLAYYVLPAIPTLINKLQSSMGEPSDEETPQVPRRHHRIKK